MSVSSFFFFSFFFFFWGGGGSAIIIILNQLYRYNLLYQIICPGMSNLNRPTLTSITIFAGQWSGRGTHKQKEPAFLSCTSNGNTLYCTPPEEGFTSSPSLLTYQQHTACTETAAHSKAKVSAFPVPGTGFKFRQESWPQYNKREIKYGINYSFNPHGVRHLLGWHWCILYTDMRTLQTP